MTEPTKTIEIEIDWDTGLIRAHVEGYSDPVECKRAIIELIDGVVDIVEGGEIEIIDKGDPNAKINLTRTVKNRNKTTR